MAEDAELTIRALACWTCRVCCRQPELPCEFAGRAQGGGLEMLAENLFDTCLTPVFKGK